MNTNFAVALRGKLTWWHKWFALTSLLLWIYLLRILSPYSPLTSCLFMLTRYDVVCGAFVVVPDRNWMCSNHSAPRWQTFYKRYIYLNFGYEGGAHLWRCALSLFIPHCFLPSILSRTGDERDRWYAGSRIKTEGAAFHNVAPSVAVINHTAKSLKHIFLTNSYFLH